MIESWVEMTNKKIQGAGSADGATHRRFRLIGDPVSWAGLLCTCSAIAFLAIAIMRRLNFDEWLVLRAGWLAVNDVSSGLHFLMPFTWLVGLLGSLPFDVAIPIYVLRIGVGTLVLGTLWWALKWQSAGLGQSRAAFLLCLVSGVFVSHAIECRYDAVILICWLLAWGLVGKPPSRRTFFFLGAVFSLLALHHTKGLFYAIGLSAYVLIAMRITRDGLVQFATGACSVFALWASVLAANGLFQEQLAIYLQFSKLAVDSIRVAPWLALRNRFEADLLWWLLILPLSVLGFWRGLKTKSVRDSMWFLGIPAAFIALHPRPWDYLVTPLIPYFAALAVHGADMLLDRIRRGYHRLLLAMVPAFFVFSSAVDTYGRSFAASNYDDIRTLRMLSTYLREGDTVLDPVGAAYFVPALDPQWYLDTLFRKALSEGRWMQLTVDRADQATIVIHSYRSRWVHDSVRTRLADSHERICGWIWLRRGDERAPAMRESCHPGAAATLQNFWGT